MDALTHLQYESKIQYMASIDTEHKPVRNYRRTSIICTIGPKTNSPEAINKLRKAGLNIVRMNCSHGDHAYHKSVIDNTREAQKQVKGRQVAIALDTKGPEIRTGSTVGDADLPIKAGTEIIFTTDEAYEKKCDTTHLYVDYKNFSKVIGERVKGNVAIKQEGQQQGASAVICVDDGKLEFEVLEIIDEKNLKARAQSDGYISSKKGVNLPDTDVDLPALSEKDKADLKFGVENGIDMVFASFIRSGADIKSIRDVLGEKGKNIQIIAKIENRQGLHNFADILKQTDGVMVARGDLGIEIPYEEVYVAQKKMIAMCNVAGKPVICATQMLESMVGNPRATRAEISDVGNAVADGADCVMLSGETAKGSYPVESVTAMHRTCLKSEGAIPYVRDYEEMCRTVARPVSTVEACAMAAVRASLDMNAGAILVLSTSGESARLLAKYRPVCPIFMVTRNATASRYSHLYRGVYPFHFEEEKPDFSKVNWQEDVDRRIKWGISQAFDLNVLSEGETVIVVQGWKGGMGNTNTVRLLTPGAIKTMATPQLDAYRKLKSSASSISDIEMDA